jgi:hypothetical protein
MMRMFLAVLLALVMGAGVAHATTRATLTASPNPVVFTDSNAYEEFTGCGYDPDAGGVTITVQTPEAYSFQGGPVGADGCIDLSFNGFITTTGTYVADAYQTLHGTNHQTRMAETSFTVVAA